MEENNNNLKKDKEISFGLALLCMIALAVIFIGGFGILSETTNSQSIPSTLA